MKKRLCVFVITAVFIFSGLGVAGTIRYEYDELNRLVLVEEPGEFIIQYDYDAAGNRVTKTVQRLSPSFDYDQDGDVDGKDHSDFISNWDGTLQMLSDFAAVFGTIN